MLEVERSELKENAGEDFYLAQQSPEFDEGAKVDDLLNPFFQPPAITH